MSPYGQDPPSGDPKFSPESRHSNTVLKGVVLNNVDRSKYEADDVVFLVPGQPVMHKVEFAAAAKSMSGPNAPQIDGKSEIQEIQICGDWAFMWTNLTVVETPPGAAQSITRAGNTLTILQKHGAK